MTHTKERANRGKPTEKAVDHVLSTWNTKYDDFAYSRLPDARAAGGRLKAQPADFSYHCGPWKNLPKLGGYIEAKETLHPSRIARDKISQLPVLRKFALASAFNVVLVHHTIENVWRIAELSWFEGTPASWDLSSLTPFPSAEAALHSIFKR